MFRVRLVGLLLLAGCAGPAASVGAGSEGPTPQLVRTGLSVPSLSALADPSTATYSVPAAPNQVWAALPIVFSSLEIPASRVGGTGRSYGNASLRTRRRIGAEPAARYLDCGTTPIGASVSAAHMLELGVVAVVEPGDFDDHSMVHVAVQATAIPPAGGSRIPCTTTRRLETRLMEELLTVLGGGA